jgi:hypothetical protein
MLRQENGTIEVLMTDMSPIACTTQKTALDKAHIWRSKFIDQASKCEAELRLIYGKTHPAAKVPAFKTMAETICTATMLTDGQNKRLAKLCQSLLPLIELRANVAHSEIGIAHIEEQQMITLANANGRLSHGRLFLALSDAEQKSAQKEMASLANQLSQFRSSLKP